jgi:hypothetical protein
VSAIPSAVAALVLLGHTLKFFDRYRPAWTKPFVKETLEASDDVAPMPERRVLPATYGLLVVCLIGLAVQIVTIFFPYRQIEAIYPCVTWVSNACL